MSFKFTDASILRVGFVMRFQSNFKYGMYIAFLSFYENIIYLFLFILSAEALAAPCRDGFRQTDQEVSVDKVIFELALKDPMLFAEAVKTALDNNFDQSRVKSFEIARDLRNGIWDIDNLQDLGLGYESLNRILSESGIIDESGTLIPIFKQHLLRAYRTDSNNFVRYKNPFTKAKIAEIAQASNLNIPQPKSTIKLANIEIGARKEILKQLMWLNQKARVTGVNGEVLTGTIGSIRGENNPHVYIADMQDVFNGLHIGEILTIELL